jgi:hypothetical protein
LTRPSDQVPSHIVWPDQPGKKIKLCLEVLIFHLKFF